MRFTIKVKAMQCGWDGMVNYYHIFDNQTQQLVCYCQSELIANRVVLALNQQNEREIAGVLLGG